MKIPPEKLDPRGAGAVRRYHNEVTVQTQTDADHAWNCARILLAIWPDAPRHLLVEALFHDIGEGFTGDTPSPAKWAHPPLAAALGEVEAAARLAMVLPWGVPPRAPNLTTEEAAVLNLVDILDAWEFCLYERALGSRFAEAMLARCETAISDRMGAISAEHDATPGADRYIRRRRAEEVSR
jgi:5'-deoxynucleotidase YfbR-like HD superfamily hydrolase